MSDQQENHDSLRQTETDGWEWIEAVRTGNQRAFDAVMARYKRPVLNFVFRMIGDAAEAEDVAQDVFVRAYRAMLNPGFRRTTAVFSTWLFQVARNAALDCLRRRRRHPAQSLAVIEDGGKSIAARGTTAAQETMARETGEQIAAAISLLPEDQRTAVILAEYGDLSIEAIAAVMKCSGKSVESRLYRARQFLRKQLMHLMKEPNA